MAPASASARALQCSIRVHRVLRSGGAHRPRAGPAPLGRGVKTLRWFEGSRGHHRQARGAFFGDPVCVKLARESAYYAGSLDAQGARCAGRVRGRQCPDVLPGPVTGCPRRPRFRRFRAVLAEFCLSDAPGKPRFSGPLPSPAAGGARFLKFLGKLPAVKLVPRTFQGFHPLP